MAISRMRRYAKVIAFLAICTVGISGCGRERGAAELPFFGTWYIEKVAVISEMYTGTTKDGVAEEDLYDSEDFVGYELEYTADYFRIGENTYTDPEYGLFFEDIFTVNDGGRFLPHVCDFMEEEGIATVYKGNIIKNLIMDCQSYTKYRPNETTGGIFVSWRRKEELPTGA